jgi:hypothetical protein
VGRASRGLSLLIVGPDGAGKSTLAEHLVRELASEFEPTIRVHWRPYVVPPLRSSPICDDTRPQARSPHGRVLSFLLLAYHWLDFFVAGWGFFRRIRARGGLVVAERGWWDIAVDPRRYRLLPASRVVLAFGRLLPRPDLVLVLDGAPSVVAARKLELAPVEVARQGSAWRALSVGRRTVVIDAAAPAAAVRREAEACVWQSVADRRPPRHTEWVALPGGRRASTSIVGGRREPRWWLPCAPRAAARASLVLYQPVTGKGVLARDAAWLLAVLGGFRLLPRRSAPPEALRRALETTVREALESSGLNGRLDDAVLAIAKCNWPGRFVVLVCTPHGTPVVLAKVAVDDAAKAALEREAVNLERLARFLPLPLLPPTLWGTGDGVLLLRPERAGPRHRSTQLPEDVAFALGRFFRAGVTSSGEILGPAHGDASPWNLLRTDRGLVLLDWEHASDAAPPFHDLFHFLVHGHSLLGRPAAHEILTGLDGEGWVAGAIAAYARGAELQVASAPRYLNAYLERSLDKTGELVDAVTDSGRAAYEARRRLQLELES